MFFKSRILAAAFLLVVLGVSASGDTWVKVAKNPEEGWRLLVDGEEMAVHGVVWSFTPIGENYSFDLWSQPEDYIKKMIDTDAALMQEMGVNVIRVFTDVPPYWITYLYQRYGIYTVVNNLFGRYGMMVDGIWHAKTNYADVRTRELILEQLKENIAEYVGVPGLLFYLLGNENNYGLEWDSDAIEDLPVGQRLEIRAGYLYSLFEEGIQIVKDLDPTKPVGIVNGDIQYLNIIEALVPSLDILGVNTYRGDAAFDLFYESVAETLDVPIVFTEFGADAYNVVEEREDQYNQALFIKNQWEEIYRQSYGKGQVGNILGGFVFQWMDEWWKTGQTEDLDIHNTTGSWNNGAYAFDAAYGVNNMNEEWFGIVAQSTAKTEGIHERRPRAAYYMLKELWLLDQIKSTNKEIDAHFAMDVQPFVNRAEIAGLEQQDRENPIVKLRGKAVFAGNGYINDVDADKDGLDKVQTSHGEWAYLGLDLAPLRNLKAGLTFRIQNKMPVSVFERGEYSRHGNFWNGALDIYDGYLHWKTHYADLDFYYHNGHTDWISEGDYFGLLPESFDFFGMDKSGSEAPYGLEITGKEFLEGLKIYGGPELYWDAEPRIIAKYYKDNETLDWSLIYDQVVGAKDIHGNSHYTAQKATGWISLDKRPWVKVDLGLLHSGAEMVGSPYDHVDKSAKNSYTVVSDKKIDVWDTLAGKFSISTEAFLYTTLFAKYIYAGRVADSNGSITTRDGSQLEDVGTGNRHEFESGFRFQYGSLSVMHKFLARIPISHPFPLALGGPRHSLYDPFAVYSNREAYQTELVVTFDPTGDTYFFDWDNNQRENATLAAYLSFLYTIYQGPTDATSYINEWGEIASFGLGLPEAYDLWSMAGRVVWNARPSIRLIGTLKGGKGQSTGEDKRHVTYYGGSLTAGMGSWIIDTSMDFDSWGNEDWYREFNITYPLQWTIDVSRGFEIPSFLDTDNRIGVRWKGRTYDEYSPDDETNSGLYEWRMEVLAYLSLSW